jgi:chaperone required for assembly of F1-ATPase
MSIRDLFDEIYTNQPLDPRESARRGGRPQLRRRFYAHATAEEGDHGFAVLLDGRQVRTPAHRTLAAPTHGLAQAIAAEWEAQQNAIDPAHMPLTRLANSIIDGVADAPAVVAAEIARYVGSDLLFYRAEGPQGLIARQAEHWDPVLDWARDVLGARFMLSAGITYVPQPERSLAAAQGAIPDYPWPLGAVHSITTLTGSALLALAVLRGQIAAEQAWAAANVDDDWNAEQWGQDELAVQRRAFRKAEMDAAATVLILLSRP